MRILIKDTSIITQNKEREFIPSGFILINNNKFEKISNGIPNERELSISDEIIDGKNTISFPGIINAHVHLGETIFKYFLKGNYSLEDYLRLTDALTKKTNLIEKERKLITDYSILNLMRSGTTTICGGRTTDSSERFGVRNVSGYMLMNSFKLKNFSYNAEEKFKREYEKIKKTNLSSLALFVHSLNTVDINLISVIKNILNKYPKVKLILHIAETKNQENEIYKKFETSSVKFLHKNKLLNKNTILIHGNWISDKDMLIVKKSGASIVHCLSSNLNVADKTLNLSNLVKNNINVCIATDGIVTGKTFSVLDEANKCFDYNNLNTKNNLITAQKLLDLITIDAAKVIGLDRIIGSIEKGKKADMVMVKKRKFGENVVKDLITKKHKILFMVLDGKLKMCNNALLMKNERKIEERFRTLTKAIKREVLNDNIG